jgi:conjugative relaxase-like TrwC/TraI family protein
MHSNVEWVWRGPLPPVASPAMGVSIASGMTPDYYKREVKESSEAARERGYYSKAVASGEPPGELLGRGLEALGLTVGSEVTDDISNRVFANLTHPTTGEALGRAQSNYATGGDLVLRAAQRHGITVPAAAVADAKDALRDTDGKRLAEFTRARALDLVASAAPGVTPEELKSIAVEATRSTRRNVKYLDMTYTSGKDWSVAHAAADAAGDDFASSAYEEALTAATRAMAGVAETLAYTRVGAHGKKVAGESTGKRLAAEGLVVAAYRHHTNRDGEMHDHAHVLVLNRALDATGKYHALDGKQLYDAVPLLAAVASRAQELVGRDKLGLRYEKNPDGTRRIAAVDEGLCKEFSTRSASIEARLDEWARLWEETNGFAPTARQRDAQHKYIQRSTRRPKSDKHLVREDQVAQWEKTSLQARGDSLSEVHQAVAQDARRFTQEALAAEAIDQDAVVCPVPGSVEARN